MQRQAAEEIPFQFKNNIKGNRPSLWASEDGDASTSVVPRDQSKGGPQNDQEDSGSVSLAPVSWLQQTLTTFYGQSSLPLTLILASKGLYELPSHTKKCQQSTMGELTYHAQPALHSIVHAHARALLLVVQGWTDLPKRLPIMCLVPLTQHLGFL